MCGKIGRVWGGVPSGNAKFEPGAVVCRVSPSFVRFGTFQLPVSRGEEEVGLVKQLADYVIRHHYSHLEGNFACSCIFWDKQS